MVKEDQTFENNIIKIGENANENDEIISQAKQTDIWFHLDKFPSCHVIISCDKKNPVNNQMLKYCATLCKEHTKYKNHNKLKVKYTEIKNVKRTKTPGRVTLKGKCKSITN